MDSLKLHQLLNYYPAIGMVLGALLLAIGLGRGAEKARRYGLRLVFAVALLTLVVVFTGEFAGWDKALYSGPRGEALAQHKLIATVAFAIVEAAGIASLVGLLRSGHHGAKGRLAVMIAFALAIVASVLLVVVIFRGRQVKWAGIEPHPEKAGQIVNCSLANCQLAADSPLLPIHNLPTDREESEFYTTEKTLWHA